MKKLVMTLGATVLLGLSAAQADQVILDDLIVDGSICAGMDCVNGESFGFDTLRLKENNLRIRADDTSSTASFPSNDWQITFNESANGGLNKFSIDDISGGRTPLTIEAGAPSHSLYVDDGGRLGLGTSTPVVDVHIKSGNSPTTRLEQDGSSGFTPQTWDMAGNEANFFVRDASNGGKIPFKIIPNAPTDSLYVAADGDVGLGTANPEGALHINRSGIILSYFQSSNNMPVQIRMRSDNDNRRFLAVDAANSVKSQLVFGNDEVQIAGATNTTNLYATFNASGLVVNGPISTTASGQVHPDYVFDPKYKLMPLPELSDFLKENRHLPEVPSATDVAKNGINMTEMQITLLKKIEEITLYTIKQQEAIDVLKNKLLELESRQQHVVN